MATPAGGGVIFTTVCVAVIVCWAASEVLHRILKWRQQPKPPCARCGCDWDCHDHREYSAGTYCCVCGWAGCRAYRRPRWWRRTAPPRIGEAAV